MAQSIPILIATLGIALTAAFLVKMWLRRGAPRSNRAADLGTMSDKWVADHERSRPSTWH